VVFKQLSTVSKVLFLQLLITLCSAASFAVLYGRQSALCALLGGLAAFLPNVYFALRIRWTVGEEPRKIVRSFYSGESGKLLLTVALFGLIFQLPNIQFLPLMASYIAVLSIFWFALILSE
jgi:ATP synthase protein I